MVSLQVSDVARQAVRSRDDVSGIVLDLAVIESARNIYSATPRLASHHSPKPRLQRPRTVARSSQTNHEACQMQIYDHRPDKNGPGVMHRCHRDAARMIHRLMVYGSRSAPANPQTQTEALQPTTPRLRRGSS